MKINIHLRNVKTGEVRVYQPDYDVEEPFNPFMWEEGNFSCDCNRSLFLYDWDDDKKLPCNPIDNVIVVDKITNRATNKILYVDFPLSYSH